MTNMNINRQYEIKKNDFIDLQKKYSEEEISWATFYGNQQQNKGKTVLVKNNDFRNGTLRIKVPCMIKLTENILFNPNRPYTWLTENNEITQDFNKATALNPHRKLDWFPLIESGNNNQYFEPEVKFAYTLGFFAAITIETHDVIIDLNGYSISQHKEHALQQRFYANIELADQPFIPMQGPSNFGAILRSARNVWIHNGKLGLSSHHGIHGNNADNILIEDITFEDFEVGSIALNGCKNVFLQDIVVTKNNHNIPVVGTYSAGRFIKNFVKLIIDKGFGSSQLASAFDELNKDLDETFDAHILKNENDNIPSFFKNTSGLIDGNPYGIIINSKGVAVNGLMENRNSSKANEVANIYINNCSINGIHAEIKEIIAIGTGLNTAVQVDTAGSVLQFFKYVSTRVDDKYFYKGTSLSNVKIELAKIKTNLEENNMPTNFFGTLNITKGIQQWKDDPEKYFVIKDHKLILKKNNNNVQIDNADVIYDIHCNGDTMFHVNKGAMGIRIDGVNGSIINNVTISNILNKGVRGSHIKGSYIKGHPAQGKMVGYHGTKTYGAILSAVNDTYINNMNVQNIKSEHGQSFGFVLQNGSCNVKIKDCSIDNIKSANELSFDAKRSILPNEMPYATGLYIDSNMFNIKVKNVDATNIVNMKDFPYESKNYDIHSNILFEK